MSSSTTRAFASCAIRRPPTSTWVSTSGARTCSSTTCACARRSRWPSTARRSCATSTGAMHTSPPARSGRATSTTTRASSRCARHDPAEAVALLDAAGLQPGTDGVRLRVACVNQDDAYLRGVAAAVARDLRAVGVELELQFAEPFAAFYGAVAADAPSFISKWLWQDPTDAIIGFAASWGAPEPNWQRSSVPALDEAFRAWLAPVPTTSCARPLRGRSTQPRRGSVHPAGHARRRLRARGGGRGLGPVRRRTCTPSTTVRGEARVGHE